jgi:hypothetical protein
MRFVGIVASGLVSGSSYNVGGASDIKKSVVFGVTSEFTCSNHWAMKFFLVKIIYIVQLSVLLFHTA